MEILCNSCANSFSVEEKDLVFYERISVTPPTACPHCRLIQRLAFRNERRLYKRTCDATNKQIISVYAPDKIYTVYDQDVWLGDSWDAADFGRKYDFNRPFFEQYAELLRAVPHPSVGYRFQSENCAYTTYQNHSKDCYLCFGSGYMQDCAYTNWSYYSKNSFDMLGASNTELCYEMIDAKKMYNSSYCQDCSNLSDCMFCYDSHSLKNCFGCVNLRNKEFCFLNEQLSEQAYKEKIAHVDMQKFWPEYQKLLLASPRRASFQLNCEDCTGDHLVNCKNVHDSFYTDDSQDARFQLDVFKNIDCYDCTRSAEAELSYQCIGGGDYYSNRFFIAGEHASFCTYCMFCINSQNLFGCVGIRSRSYCILNKQYTKQEYEELVPRIIEHLKSTNEWGSFFPVSISPFTFEESLAYDYGQQT